MLIRRFILRVAPPLVLLGASCAHAQDHRDFDRGMRDGGRGGHYENDGRHHYRDYRDDRDHRGGIGPGKGALIGGAGGAVLGALFGGGLKGSIIGGAAGAGIGAVVGEAHQDNRRDDRYRYPR
jgi:hypothetical protein